jgi:hypothetical protein
VTEVEKWLRTVLSEIHARNLGDFAGLGLVFYTDRNALPTHPLVHSDFNPSLPAKTLRDSIELFAQISRRTSICHDGFHLIQAETGFVTEVSQFLSPPIPHVPLKIERAGGARHMAARLTSLIPGVALTAVCTLESEVSLYDRGEVRTIQIRPVDGR